MLCPYCGVGIKPRFTNSVAYVNTNSEDEELDDHAHEIGGSFCPECEGFIVKLRIGDYETAGGEWYLSGVSDERIIYPNRKANRLLPPEVPDKYKKDFLEAESIVEFSPAASAALSRRVLQHILKEEFKINKFNLAEQISMFIKLTDIPSFLTNEVDAIRIIGNFAAHPLKGTQSGEVLEVEPGEAEWSLDVLENLFDFTFVQPKKHKERIDKLNMKLKDLGKPLMRD